jgi:virulence-associated protein VagC
VKHFRLEDRDLRIRKRGNEISVDPAPGTWSWLDAIATTLDADFVEGALEEPEMIDLREQWPPTE